MNTLKLISIARRCGDRTTDCQTNCPFYGQADCTVQLINALADKAQEQRSEIERLTNYNRCIDAQCRDLLDKEEKAKAKAIKEFKCGLIEQIEYIEDAHQAEYKDDFGKGWMAGFNSATHLITGAIDYIVRFENRGAENENL